MRTSFLLIPMLTCLFSFLGPNANAQGGNIDCDELIESLEGNPTDPLNDPIALIDFDYCCGQDPRPLPCYDFNRVIDYWGHINNIPSTDEILVTIKYPDDLEQQFYLDKGAGFNHIADNMNEFSMIEFGLYPEFVFEEYHQTMCATQAIPNGYDKKYREIILNYEPCSVPDQSGKVESIQAQSQPFPCQIVIKPDTINCENYQPDPDLETYFDPNGNTNLENLYLFPGDPDNNTPPIFTEDISNMPPDPNAPPGAPSGADIAFLMNEAMTNGGLDMGLGCININCIDVNSLIDALWEVEEIADSLEVYLGSEGNLQDNIVYFNHALETQLSGINFAEEINGAFGLNWPTGNCPGDVISWGDIETEGLQAGGEVSSRSNIGNMPVGKNANDLNPEYDFFGQDLPGLNAVASGVSNPSPSALEMIRNVNSGVDLYNGSQSSSIPLYSLNARDLSMPIGVGSNNNGLKVDDMGTLMGQNWSLNAGGSISRVVNGLPDEFCGTVQGVGRGRRPELIFRGVVPSSVGLGLDFPLSLGKACGKESNQVHYGMTVAKIGFPSGDTIRWSWHPLHPEIIRTTFQMVLHQFTIPFTNLSLKVTLDVGVDLGFAVNQKIGEVNYEETGMGYLYSDDMDDGCVPPFFKSSGLDYDDMTSLNGDEPNPEQLLDIHNNRNIDDQAFLNDQVSNFQNWKEAISLLVSGQQTYSTNQLDTEPDEFYFNIGGYSGYFHFIADEEVTEGGGYPKVVTFPYYQHLKIETSINQDANGIKHITQFIVTTPEGMKYTFGREDMNPEGEFEGVDFTENTEYYLPTFYTYPEKVLDRSTFGKAEVDMGQLLTYPLGFGPPQIIKFANTYDRNYKITNRPRYSSTWHLTKVESCLTLEEIDLEYDKRDLRYYSNKSLSHSFPNFGVSGTPGNYELKTITNDDLVPAIFRTAKTKWENGRAELAYSATETKLERWHMTEMSTNRDEKVLFIYETDRGEVVGDKVCSRIEVHRNNTFFKGWQFDYEIQEATPSISNCNELPEDNDTFGIAPPIAIEDQWVYDLGDLYLLKNFELHSYLFLTLRLNCFKPTFQIPFPYLSIISFAGNHRTQISEFGSLMDVKGMQGMIPLGEYNEEVEIFHAENKRTFLRKIWELDRAWTTDDNGDHRHEFVTSIDYNDESALPKRFSIHQDPYGYHTDNTLSGSPLPKLKFGTWQPFHQIKPIVATGSVDQNAFDLFYGFKNAQLPSSQIYQGRAGHDFEFADDGSVKSILLATGGKISFDYESNILPDGSEGGGIRVKSLIEDPGNSPARTTKYLYESPTVWDKPIYIFQNALNYYYRTGSDILENRVVTSSSPQNRIWSNRNSYIGYEKVTEKWDGMGKVVHHYSSPEEIPHDPRENGEYEVYLEHYWKMTHVRKSAFNLPNSFEEKVFFNWWDETQWLTPKTESHSFAKFALAHVGLEKLRETYNGAGELVQEQATSLTCTNVSKRLDYLVSDMYQFNSPGSHLERFGLRLLKGYKPFREDSIGDLISFLIDLIFNGGIVKHPFKEVRRNFTVNEIRVRSYRVVPEEVLTYDYYPDNSVSWSKSVYHYGFGEQDKELISHIAPETVTTTFSDGSKIEVINVFGRQNGDPQPPSGIQLFSGVLNYLETELPEYYYSVPLYSKKYLNDSPDPVEREITVPQELNGRLVPLLNYTLFNGEEGLAGRVDAYNLEGMPTSYSLARFGATPNGAPGVEFFNPITFSWNARLQLESRAYEGFLTSYEYDPSTFELIKVTDPDQVESSFSYDLRGRLGEEVSLNGRQTKEYSYTIGPGNNTVSTLTHFSDNEISPQARRVILDGLGKELEIIRTGGDLVKAFQYDNFFRVVSEYNLGSGQRDIERHNSPIERFMVTTDAVGNVTQNIYSTTNEGYLISTVTDPNGHSSKTFQDAIGRTIKTISAEGSTTEYQYDDLGRLEKIVNPILEEYQYEYNDIGQVWRKKVPGSADQYVLWSKSFRPILTRDANENYEIRTYDDLNRITTIHAANNGFSLSGTAFNNVVDDNAHVNDQGELLLENTYVNNHTWLERSKERILTDADPSGFGGFKDMENLNLDDLGRPGTVLTTYPHGSVSVMPTYADAGVILDQTITMNGPESITADYFFKFDQHIRPTETKLNFEGTEVITSLLKYNPLDQVVTKHLGGVGAGNYLQNVDFGYDAIGRLTNINSPAENECIRNEPSCDLSSVFRIQLNQRYYYRATGIEIDGQLFTFSPPIPLGEPNDVPLLTAAIEEAIEYFDHEGEVEILADLVSTNQGTFIEYQINITGATFTTATLRYEQCIFPENCTPFQAGFEFQECCDKELPEDVPPPPSFNASEDLFYEKIEYNGIDISQINLYSDCTVGHMINEYTYDGNHRLLNCRNTLFHPTEGRIDHAYSTGYTYDLAGNLESLQRNGYIPPVSGTGLGTFAQSIDDLSYSYQTGTSKLIDVADGLGLPNAEYGLQGNANIPAYDDAGNIKEMTRQHGHDVDITYNRLNLPQFVESTHGGGTFGMQVDYTYGGEKTRHNFTVNPEERIYLGGAEFKDGVLQFYSHGDGRIVKDPATGDLRWQYTIQDHLGNTVVLFEDRDGNGTIDTEIDVPPTEVEVLQRNFYYSFGMEMDGPWHRLVDPEQDYLYNGKEKIAHEDVDLRWLNYGFRWYDPAVGRFTGVDPIAEQFAWVNGFNYAENEPIGHIDLWGLQKFYSNDGTFLGKYGKSSEERVITGKKNPEMAREVFKSGDESQVKAFVEMIMENKHFSAKLYRRDDLNQEYDKFAQTYKGKPNEYVMAVFEKTFHDENGESFKGYRLGRVHTNYKPRNVYLSGSKFYGSGSWKLFAAIHNHPSGADFSGYSNNRDGGPAYGLGRTNDLGWSLHTDAQILLVRPNDSRIRAFDPWMYKMHMEINQYDEYSITERNIAIHKAISNRIIGE